MLVKNRIIILIFNIILIGLILCIHGNEIVLAQQPTIAVATVTGTPEGPVISVRPQEQDQVNVREGPGTTYPKVGVLLIGQTLPAKGKSAGGDWIMIEYPGVPGGTAWVYAPLVNLSGGELPIIEPPPTPTPMYTPTIDPTLAARFVITTQPTRFPTYTAPPPLNIPTIQAEPKSILPTGIPMGLIIIILFAGGLFIGLFTLAQGR
jgi:uncharacterized protein YraI